MNRTPVTSVVIPAYNAEDYLGRTLHSVLSQSYRDLEVLVIDDGSTDNTSSIADRFASEDCRVRVVRVPNGGVAHARNLGIENATGEFVAFLDADDLWHPSKIQSQVSALSSSEGAGAAAAYTRMRIIDWEDRVIRNGGGVASSGRAIAHHMFARPVGNGSSLMVRREVAQELGGFDPSLHARGIGGCEDLDFELKIVARYPLIYINRYLVGYRSHAANMSTMRVTLAKSILATIEFHLSSHPELPPWAVQKIRAATLEFALQSLSGMGRPDLFASELLHLLKIDMGRGLIFATRFVARKVLRPLLELRSASRRKAPPFFYELDPDLDCGLPRRPPRRSDVKIMRRLQDLDPLQQRSKAVYKTHAAP